jgi:hypothetical protein
VLRHRQRGEITIDARRDWPVAGQLSEIRPDAGQAPERTPLVVGALQASQELGRDRIPLESLDLAASGENLAKDRALGYIPARHRAGQSIRFPATQVPQNA